MNMIVLPNDGLASSAIARLEKEGIKVLNTKVAQEQLASYINENKVTVLIVRSATKVRKDLIDACPGLKIVARAGIGLDNIDVDYAESKGIKVINTPYASGHSVGELVIGHAVSLARFLHDSNRVMPLDGDTKFSELKSSYAQAIELKGKTMGIIGFGRIGQAVAKVAYGFGMNVIASDVEEGMKKDLDLEFFDGQKVKFSVETIALDKLLKESDVVTIHVPRQEKYTIGEKELSQMKSTAFLINLARGGVIDEVALLKALDEEKLGGAAIDVFEKEPQPGVQLLMHPMLSLSPHIGGTTIEAQGRIGDELVDQLLELRS